MPSERNAPSGRSPEWAAEPTKGPLDKLADFVLTHRGHFALALVRCNSARQRDGMLRVLGDGLAQEGTRLEILQLELHKVDDLLAWIREATSGPGPAKPDALGIAGLEGSLPSEGAFRTFAARLNLQRDAIAAEFGGPILLWLTDYAMDLFVRVAPDFADYARLVLRVRDAGAFVPGGAPPGRAAPLGPTQDPPGPQPDAALDQLHDRISEIQRKGVNAARSELLDLASLLSLAASRFEGTRDRRTSLPYLDEAEATYRQLGILEEEADVAGRTGLVCRAAGDFPRSIRALERALRLHRQAGSRRGEAADLGNLGLCYQTLGDLPRAIEHHEAALRIDREIGARQGEANQLGNLGNCYRSLGDLPKAIEHYEAALRLDREIGARQGEAADLGNLGNCYQTLGDLPKAIEHHEAALRLDREIGARQGEAADLGNLGAIFNQRGRYDGALACWLPAVAIFQEIGSPRAQKTSEWIAQLEARTRLKLWWWRRLAQARSNPKQVLDSILKDLGSPR